MQLASVLDQYHDALQAKYGSQLLPGHLRAIDAIRRCRTPEAGELFVQCLDCGHSTWRPRSCGHRSCPQCQNHEASLWLDRQQVKLLPVEYFMATFTLPYEIRFLVWDNQTLVYDLLFACVSSTLKDFGLNPKNLGANIGMSAILHTHNRRLDYHPHIHVVVPGGGVDKARKQWKKKKDKYLFNEFALAKVFRARFLDALNKAGVFLWLVLQHVLPKGFRRVRDYGFLHGNAKKLLSLVQMVLQVLIEACTCLLYTSDAADDLLCVDLGGRRIIKKK